MRHGHRRFALAVAGLTALSLSAHAQESRGELAAKAEGFLKTHGAAPGVLTIPGVQYRVISSGPADGPAPTRADDVTVRYEGRLLSGEVFDASPPGQTTTFELKRLIPGWITALQLMHVGDVWEIWVPPEMAYGYTARGKIPPGSVLDFKVTLVAVAPHADPPTR